MRHPFHDSLRPALLALVLLCLALTTACGGGAPSSFVETPPASPGDTGGGSTPAPTPPAPDAWQPDAFSYERTAFFGSFPSALVRHGDTLFVSDADQIEGGGARILAIDISDQVPTASSRFQTVTILATALVDSAGATADVNAPVGFGFFVNEILIVNDNLGFALVNAGGSDSTPTLSNLVAFNPTTGSLLQVENLTNLYAPGRPLFDSTGASVPGGTFTQAGAEGVEFVPTTGTRGLLYIAMSNLVFGTPSYGADKFPGTIQVFDVNTDSREPVSAISGTKHTTRTLATQAYNPVAIQHLDGFGAGRVLVTCAGTTAFDANWNLVPVTNSTIEVFDAQTGAFEGQFLLGLAGLSAIRPAIGRDGVGHLVGFFPSSVTGEVYLLQLDGLAGFRLDPTQLAVLRGPANGIPITAAQAGAPGGNITGTALSPDGRTLVVSGFGDLFAGEPGHVYLLALPADVVTGSGFGANFIPGSTAFASVPGRTTGEVVVVPAGATGNPDVFVNVGGAVDTSTGLGSGPASLGTLSTGGLIR